MTEFQKAAQHRILPARRLGDTLVVTPSGSLAGFGVGEANREQARLAGLLANPEIQSLVIDLHGADYFGSEMVGVFVRLQQACRGTTALVGVAPGMRKVLEVMRLEEFFSFYRSERQALRAIARIPLRQRFFQINAIAAVAALACLFVATGWFAWSSNLVYRAFGSPVARDYCALNDLWSNFRQLQVNRNRGSFEEREAARNELHQNLERLKLKVSMRSSLLVGNGPETETLQDALQSFAVVLRNDGDPKSEITFVHFMYCTRNNIQHHTGLSVPAPASPRTTHDA